MNGTVEGSLGKASSECGDGAAVEKREEGRNVQSWIAESTP